ncbi:MAG: MFS transporter [Candidatus Thermoplasmatota archaeon]|nr:MFS transporter [Candidatus Thermoplasmatota archaeon]
MQYTGRKIMESGKGGAVSGSRLLIDVIIIITIAMTMRATNNMIVTTTPPLARYDLLFTTFGVGVISALSSVATFVSTSLINVRFGNRTRRPFFLLSTVLSGVVMVGFYFSNYVTIWIAVVVSGIVYGIIFPNIITYAMSRGEGMNRERILSLYSVSLSLGLIIGPSMEAYALNFVSYRFIFLLFIPISAVGIFLSFFVRFPDTGKKPAVTSSMKNPGFVASILNITIYNIAFSGITTFVVIFAKESLGISGSLAFTLFIFFFGVSFGTRLFMSIRPFKFLKKPVLISTIITAGALFSLPFAHNFYLLAIIMALLGIPHGVIFPISTIMISRGTKPEERNTINSYFLAYNNFLFIMVPVVFGYISQYISYGFSFMLLGLPTIASCVILFRKFGNDRRIFYR